MSYHSAVVRFGGVPDLEVWKTRTPLQAEKTAKNDKVENGRNLQCNIRKMAQEVWGLLEYKENGTWWTFPTISRVLRGDVEESVAGAALITRNRIQRPKK